MTPNSEADAGRPVQVVLVSKVRLFREAVARLLRRQPMVNVAATADVAPGLLALLGATAADVVLLDLGSPGALALATTVADRIPRLPVLGFAVEEHESEIIACAEAGLSGYVPCDASIAELITALHSVANGSIVCSEHMAGGLFRHLGRVALARPEPPPDGLTHRQQQIARLLGDGLSNKEIARRLSLGTATVKNHVHNILDRLEVSRRSQVAARLRPTQPSDARR